MPTQWSCFSTKNFHKLCKSGFSQLKKLRHEIMGYLDDSFICGDSLNEYKAAVTDTLELYHNMSIKS